MNKLIHRSKFSNSYSRIGASKGLLANRPHTEGRITHQERIEKTPPSGLKGKKFLSNEEILDRKSKGLCFYCDENFSREHFLTKHKKNQLYILELDDDGDDCLVEDEIIQEEEGTDIAKISVNAMAGITGFQTMKVKGVCGGVPMYIIIDSGSIHNFIDDRIAARLKCKTTDAGTTRVTVAGGTKLEFKARINKFKWRFQNQTFAAAYPGGEACPGFSNHLCEFDLSPSQSSSSDLAWFDAGFFFGRPCHGGSPRIVWLIPLSSLLSLAAWSRWCQFVSTANSHGAFS